MKQFLSLILISGIFGAIAFFVPRLIDQQSAPILAEIAAPADCDLKPGTCPLTIQGRPVEILLTDTLTPLKPVELTLRGEGLSAVRVDFEMIGMDMGDNHFNFLSAGDGEWKATVVLPVCALGRNDWLALFDLQYKDQPDGVYRINYPFVVIGH